MNMEPTGEALTQNNPESRLRIYVEEEIGRRIVSRGHLVKVAELRTEHKILSESAGDELWASTVMRRAMMGQS